MSSRHAVEIFNLRLTENPVSFIFLIQHGDRYFIVWETYKTEEATYIWKLKGNNVDEFKNEVKELLDTIKKLRAHTKLAYLKLLPANFKKIDHHYNGADNGFKKWQTLIEQFFQC